MVTARKTQVIFDMDGTLLDTERLYTLAAQSVVGRYGKVYDWSVKRLVIGGDPWDGARRIVQHLALPITPEEYLHEREIRLRELCRNVAPMPGALELVTQLTALGTPLGIGTSSQREITELKLTAANIARHFACVVCSDDRGITHGKPAPDIYLAVARGLGAEPSSCIVLEDTPNGVRAAIAAGMEVIAVIDENMRGEDFSGALHILSSLGQVTPSLLGVV
ncbi:MAG TPA: HAD-IA family hydrolase [Polyangiales bacterium]|nr:HAD-IA family hydrolase [Polyangiales bacterium]